jgi:hypothetical protein
MPKALPTALLTEGSKVGFVREGTGSEIEHEAKSDGIVENAI